MEQENKNYYKFTIITTKNVKTALWISKKTEQCPKITILYRPKRKLLRNTMYIEKENKLFGIFDQISHGRHSFSKKKPDENQKYSRTGLF